MVAEVPLRLPLETPIAAESVAAQCADCAAPVSGNYCAACGQETRIETPTVRHFLQEFADQYVALEGKLGRSLRVLILQPGQLTLDYVEGRRQRYVRPLKLYLTISLIFFALLGLLPDSSQPFAKHVGAAESGAVVIDLGEQEKSAAKPDAATAESAAVGTDAAGAGSGRFEKRLRTKAAALAKLGAAEQRRLLRDKLADDAPYAMFFLLPYFALLLHWFYRRQKLLYGVHLLFSLHLHSFLFILLAVGFLPLPAILGKLLEAGIGVYVFLALRRVYGGTWQRTLWRMFWLWACYLIAVAASAASGVLAVVLNGAPA